RGFGADPVLMHYFDAASGYEWENYAGFDLDALADAVYTNSSGEIQTAAANLKTALEATIIDSWAGSSYTDTGFEPGKNGLSIFFPDGDADNANRTDDTYTYWTYQYFYSSLPHDVISTWAGNSGLNYGAIDFCNGDGDGTVEGWFELLQYWYNPTGSDSIHPGPMW
ncbi:MAG: hypothetical protein H8D65_01500, partial [Spirochaetes bacterium]|nr:hypothetical protein [Spirochaetota bacterium]